MATIPEQLDASMSTEQTYRNVLLQNDQFFNHTLVSSVDLQPSLGSPGHSRSLPPPKVCVNNKGLFFKDSLR